MRLAAMMEVLRVGFVVCASTSNLLHERSQRGKHRELVLVGGEMDEGPVRFSKCCEVKEDHYAKKVATP